MVFFLDSLPSFANDNGIGGLNPSTLLPALLAIFAAMMVFAILVYVYLGFAFMAIAKKAKLKMPGLAWIPGIGPLIIAYKTSKMHWWPWLLFISILLAWIPVFGAIIYTIAIIVFFVYAVIWHWKMFEAINKPGWWAILYIIPIVNWIIIGIAAWSKK